MIKQRQRKGPLFKPDLAIVFWTFYDGFKQFVMDTKN